ncbi:hypothetical protein QOT17_022542 [Balamuthia mandrillaris]
MRQIVAVLLFSAMLAVSGAEDAQINFFFAGMIPESSSSGGSCSCSASSESSCSGGSSPTHYEFTVVEVSTTDVADSGFGTDETVPLQRIAWANQLWNEQKTEVVGHNIGTCTVTPAINNEGSAHQLCHVVHYYNNGADQLVIVGATTFESVPQTVAVVGGAGAFAGAYGSCTYQPFPNYDVNYVCSVYIPN